MSKTVRNGAKTFHKPSKQAPKMPVLFLGYSDRQMSIFKA